MDNKCDSLKATLYNTNKHIKYLKTHMKTDSFILNIPQIIQLIQIKNIFLVKSMNV